SDAAGKLASPYRVLQITSAAQAVDQILKVIAEEQVERIVIGLPLNMDDSVGPSAKSARELGREISARAGKPIVFVDERLSSFAAEQNLLDRRRGGEKITRGQKKARLDAKAAALFLQEFLDGKLSSLP